MTETFRVGVTRDLCGPDGRPVFDLGLGVLDEQPGVSWEFLAVQEPVLAPETVAAYDALMIWEPGAVTALSLEGSTRLAIIARFGMGLDAIDLDACSAHGVAVTTAPDAVRDAVPTGAIAMLLSLAHGLPAKDRLVRSGRWDERFEHIGLGTNGRVLGIIGLGNVGDSIALRAAPLGLRCLAYDPYTDAAAARESVELVELDALLAMSDFVCVACPLTHETRHLLDRPRLARMRRGSYLINVARGPIVDIDALVEVLADGHLAGAALDVFDPEPIGPDHPLLGFDTVILSPHAIAYTTAAFRDLGRTATAAVLAVHRGETPAHLANPAALQHTKLGGPR